MADMFEIMFPERYKVLRGHKLDCLYKMSDHEWRGTLNNGEFYILLEYKLVLIQIDIQQREMFLGKAKKVVLGNPVKDFNIYDCCDFFEWNYNPSNIID
tara:strand:+ start:235 stop:531 length:297 start_codon:yes stop_codon:yes gene_type:complete